MSLTTLTLDIVAFITFHTCQDVMSSRYDAQQFFQVQQPRVGSKYTLKKKTIYCVAYIRKLEAKCMMCTMFWLYVIMNHKMDLEMFQLYGNDQNMGGFPASNNQFPILTVCCMTLV